MSSCGFTGIWVLELFSVLAHSLANFKSAGRVFFSYCRQKQASCFFMLPVFVLIACWLLLHIWGRHESGTYTFCFLYFPKCWTIPLSMVYLYIYQNIMWISWMHGIKSTNLELQTNPTKYSYISSFSIVTTFYWKIPKMLNIHMALRLQYSIRTKFSAVYSKQCLLMMLTAQ